MKKKKMMKMEENDINGNIKNEWELKMSMMRAEHKEEETRSETPSEELII